MGFRSELNWRKCRKRIFGRLLEIKIMIKRRKTIFITGASRGLGFALTQKFIRKRWAVVSLVRQEKDATRLKEIGYGHCFPILSDVTTNDVKASIKGLLKSFGNIDVLINNAGIGGNSDTFAQTTADEVLSLLNVHCLGVLRVTQAVLPFMKKDGTIINISSRFGSITKVETGQLDDIKFVVNVVNHGNLVSSIGVHPQILDRNYLIEELA